MTEQFDEYGEYVDEGTGEITNRYPTVLPGYQTGGCPVFVPNTSETMGGLAKRVSKAILAIEGRIEKSGYNAHFRFKYATSEDVKAAARTALAEQEVFLLPAMKGLPTRERQGNQWLYTVEYWFTLVFPEGVAYVPWVSESLDTSDKGLPKSLTTCVKYFLISLLLIPTGDDPDSDAGGESGGGDSASEEKPKQPRRQSGTRQPRKPAKPKSKDDGAAKKSWPAETVKAVIGKGFVEDLTPAHCINLLNLSDVIGPEDAVDVVLDWVAYYRDHKQAGKETPEAKKLADATIRAWMDKNTKADEWIRENAGEVPEKKED